nr:RNA-directed DNA polymerase, eukaryota, reverse transcriptase zinc-binding domain protein [Tanacetum cinerariifolium]
GFTFLASFVIPDQLDLFYYHGIMVCFGFIGADIDISIGYYLVSSLNVVKASNKDGGDPQKKGSLLSDLAKKVKNIDGKVLGKDGKPMKPYHCVNFKDTSIENTGGCVDAMESGSVNDDVVKGFKPLPVANDTIQAAVGITFGKKPIPVVNVTENPT